jgi:hypothetical protein
MVGWVNVAIPSHRAGSGKVGAYAEHLGQGAGWQVFHGACRRPGVHAGGQKKRLKLTI